jgi:hypothetical protein
LKQKSAKNAKKQEKSGQNLFDVLRQIDQLDTQRLAAPLPEPFQHILIQSLARDPRQRTLTMAARSAS